MTSETGLWIAALQLCCVGIEGEYRGEYRGGVQKLWYVTVFGGCVK